MCRLVTPNVIKCELYSERQCEDEPEKGDEDWNYPLLAPFPHVSRQFGASGHNAVSSVIRVFQLQEVAEQCETEKTFGLDMGQGWLDRI